MTSAKKCHIFSLTRVFFEHLLLLNQKKFSYIVKNAQIIKSCYHYGPTHNSCKNDYFYMKIGTHSLYHYINSK